MRIRTRRNSGRLEANHNEAFIGLAVLACAGGLAGILTLDGHRATADEHVPNLLAFDNEAGQARTFNVNGAIDLNNPFFQDLGTNASRIWVPTAAAAFPAISLPMPGPSRPRTSRSGSRRPTARIPSSRTTMARIVRASTRDPSRRSERRTACS